MGGEQRGLLMESNRDRHAGGMVIALLCGLLALAFAAPASARSLSTMPTNSSVLPVEIEAQQVLGLLGVTAHQLSAFTCEKGNVRPLVFQVDDVNPKGRVVSARSSETMQPDEAPGVVDKNDRIVVMQRDLGTGCDSEQLDRAQGRLVPVQVKAVHFREPAMAYFLVSERGYLQSKSYVLYNRNSDRIKTEGYLWGYDGDNPCVFIYMEMNDLEAASDQNVVDRLKVRFDVKALGSLIQLSIDEDDFDCTLESARAGPVRVVREYLVYVTPLPGFKLKAYVTFTHYERLWRGRVRFEVPKPAALFTSSLDVLFASDYTDLRGVRLSTSALPAGAIVDGREIDAERSIAFGPEPWLYMSGRGIHHITTLEMEEGLNLEARAVMHDSETIQDPPERVPGSLPLQGYQFIGWEDLEARWYRFGSDMAFLPGTPEGGGAGFYKLLKSGLQAKEVQLKAGN